MGYLPYDGTWNGLWTSYPNQQKIWTDLYLSLLTNNNFAVTFLSTHGSPTYHLFSIDSSKVKNNKLNSMIYEIEACNTGNYAVQDYIAGDYLFYGKTLAVSAYSIPFVMRGIYNLGEADENNNFLKIKKGEPVVNALFLKNYENSLYFGDPLLQIK